MKIVLPLPDRALHPNARFQTRNGAMHKARKVAAYRTHAAQEAAVACGFKPPRWEKAAVQAVFYFKDSRRRDKDGALSSIKAALDGLQDAEIVVNDSGITPLPPIMNVDREHPRVELTIVELNQVEEQIAEPATSFKRQRCSACGLPMTRGIQPNKIVCELCGRVAECVDAKLYPWE